MHTTFIYRLMLTCSVVYLSSTSIELNAQSNIDTINSVVEINKGDKQKEKINTLHNLLLTISAIRNEVTIVREKQLNDTLTETEKLELIAQEEYLTNELTKSNQNLVVISSGVDPSLFAEAPPEKSIDLSNEVNELIYPIVKDIKQATDRPREIERLRSEIGRIEEKQKATNKAISQLNSLLAVCEDNKVREYLKSRIYHWSDKSNDLRKELETIKLSLEEKENNQETFLDVLKKLVHKFFSSHGKNLLLAILALIGSFFILRLLHRALRRKIRNERYTHWRSILRIADVVYYFFTIVVSLAFFIIVLMSASDWLLLGLSILFIIGLFWLSKNALPIFIEQIKLLLDLGPVREGERVMYNGVPYKVDNISMYSDLINPAFENHQIILPIKDLIDMRSRKYNQGEVWFPSLVGDWIKLDDGSVGEVLDQTPDFVTIITERGSPKIYTTENYLANNPQNLSKYGFAIEQIVGIHYKYRDTVNEYICGKLENYLYGKLLSGEYANSIKTVIVELEEMNESSIDIEIVTKFTGEAAFDYIEIPGRINQLVLDCLNDMGVEIPFPHLTLDGIHDTQNNLIDINKNDTRQNKPLKINKKSKVDKKKKIQKLKKKIKRLKKN